MNIHAAPEIHLYAPGQVQSAGVASRADAITTQLVRHALISAANQMKRVLIRTAFSPGIYEAHDFAVAIYDRQIRLLAQAPSLPCFLGTMSFCIEAAVASVGGEAALEPGDVILYNVPFGTGSHAQDMAIVLPVFRNGVLVGYAASKGHLMDIGAKDPFCTDTVDMYQEGLILDGILLFRRGCFADEIMKIITSNSRMPSALKGDILAQVACCRAGGEELLRIIDRFGWDSFLDCSERIFDHGEAVVRDFISRIPDGRYQAKGHLDDDGIGDSAILFDVELTIEGDQVLFDLSSVPEAAKGPINSPLPSTVAACRVVLALLAGNESLNEGHFRPVHVKTRINSLFHPIAPQPTFYYGASVMQLMEALLNAFAEALPGAVASGSAGDLCGLMVYAYDQAKGETSAAGFAMSVGQGAFLDGDGTTLIHLVSSTLRMPSAELMESKFNFLQYENWEVEPDSCGPGQFRGGLGWRARYRFLRDVSCMIAVDRTKVPSWAQAGGHSGTPNGVSVTYPDGRVEKLRKSTGLALPQGSVLEIVSGGGGGYGPPEKRTSDSVLQDVRLGYVSEAAAREWYPQAFA